VPRILGGASAFLTLLMLASISSALSGCSPLRTFNSLVPKDSRGEVHLRGAAYGTHPRQRLDIYRPRQRGRDARAVQRPLPIILFIYGGSWQSGTREGYGFAGRALASKGFLVVIPDYRLVPEVRFPAFVKDGAAAFRWARANAAALGGDPSRIVLVGHSAGAYNAAMLALDPRWLGEERRALRGFVGLAGPYDFLPLTGPVTRAAFAGASNLRETQPISFASAGDPPSLLLHGSRDTTVYPRNSLALAERLRIAGVGAHAKLYPQLGHVGIVTALARPFRGRAPVLDDVAAFAHGVSGGVAPAESRRRDTKG
jgi:acetyl esterase/lipase